ncbi:MAG: hypothetical protein A4E53_00394 [Pelotomaculum sp. PtaB.Bin104]|nr:MAG: hypothetical protein A4E53_00394 [Pelotomaculum sp. PtaB.Bin104]
MSILSDYQWHLTAENVKSVLENILPGPEVKGDPFWAVMEVERNGLTTGVYHTIVQDSQNGKEVLPLYERKDDAEKALQGAKLNDMAVRGISRSHMRVLVEFQKKGFIHLGVCAFVSDNGNIGVICPSAEHIRQMLEEMGRWHDEI